MLTSKDTDFCQRSLVFGVPPKVVWLRIGNVSTAGIATLLRQRYVAVRRFYEDADATLPPLELILQVGYPLFHSWQYLGVAVRRHLQLQLAYL